MVIATKGQSVRAKLGNLRFGGVIKFVVITQHWKTKEEIRTYTIELPCKLFIETTEIIGVE